MLDFKNPDSIAAYYMEQLRHQEQEVMICMMLDNQNHLLGDTVLSKGTVNATLITPREVYSGSSALSCGQPDTDSQSSGRKSIPQCMRQRNHRENQSGG